MKPQRGVRVPWDASRSAEPGLPAREQAPGGALPGGTVSEGGGSSTRGRMVRTDDTVIHLTAFEQDEP